MQKLTFPDYNRFNHVLEQITKFLNEDNYERVNHHERMVLVEDPDYNNQHGQFLIRGLADEETQLISDLFKVYLLENTLDDNYRCLATTASFQIIFHHQNNEQRKSSFQKLDLKLREVAARLLSGWEEIAVNSDIVLESAEGARKASETDESIVQYRRKDAANIKTLDILRIFAHFACNIGVSKIGKDESNSDYHTFLKIHNYPDKINGLLKFSTKDAYITGKKEYVQQLFVSMKEHLGVNATIEGDERPTKRIKLDSETS